MIWLIGNCGMLGAAVENMLKLSGQDYFASDIGVDITNLAVLSSFVGQREVEWIINCSGYTNVDGAEDAVEQSFAINDHGVANIVATAKLKGARLIHISTDYVFDGKKTGGYTELDGVAPIGVYGKSKLAGEERVIKGSTQYYILRTAWLYGKNGKNFVETMLKLFSERSEISVVNDQWGTPTYAVDLAVAIGEIIGSPDAAPGIYNFSNLGRTNWYLFAKEIYAQAVKIGKIQRDVTIHAVASSEYPTKAARPANSYLLKDKFMQTFDLKIPTWEEALAAYLQE